MNFEITRFDGFRLTKKPNEGQACLNSINIPSSLRGDIQKFEKKMYVVGKSFASYSEAGSFNIEASSEASKY